MITFITWKLDSYHTDAPNNLILQNTKTQQAHLLGKIGLIPLDAPADLESIAQPHQTSPQFDKENKE